MLSLHPDIVMAIKAPLSPPGKQYMVLCWRNWKRKDSHEQTNKQTKTKQSKTKKNKKQKKTKKQTNNNKKKKKKKERRRANA